MQRSRDAGVSEGWRPRREAHVLDSSFDVLVGSYLRDHSDNEIAEMIGRKPVTVRSLRRRALKALSAAIGMDALGEPTKEVSNGEPGVNVA